MAAPTLHTTNTVNGMPNGAIPWAISATSADWQACLEIKAAGGADVSHYITKVIFIAGGAAEEISFGDGVSGTAVETPLFTGLIVGASGAIVLEFSRPIMLTANKPITMDVASGGDVSVYIEGFTL